MSKLTADSFETFVKGGAKTLRAVLIYGQDDGLVEESRIKAARAVVDDLKDPFRAVWLTPAQIKEDISALSAEANALSLMGGRRVIMVRGADNTLTAALKDFLPAYDGDALLLFTAGALKTKENGGCGRVGVLCGRRRGVEAAGMANVDGCGKNRRSRRNRIYCRKLGRGQIDVAVGIEQADYLYGE